MRIHRHVTTESLKVALERAAANGRMHGYGKTPAVDILEAIVDRIAIEQSFHDVLLFVVTLVLGGLDDNGTSQFRTSF